MDGNTIRSKIRSVFCQCDCRAAQLVSRPEKTGRLNLIDRSICHYRFVTLLMEVASSLWSREPLAKCCFHRIFDKIETCRRFATCNPEFYPEIRRVQHTPHTGHLRSEKTSMIPPGPNKLPKTKSQNRQIAGAKRSGPTRVTETSLS